MGISAHCRAHIHGWVLGSSLCRKSFVSLAEDDAKDLHVVCPVICSWLDAWPFRWPTWWLRVSSTLSATCLGSRTPRWWMWCWTAFTTSSRWPMMKLSRSARWLRSVEVTAILCLPPWPNQGRGVTDSDVGDNIWPLHFPSLYIFRVEMCVRAHTHTHADGAFYGFITILLEILCTWCSLGRKKS